MKPRLALLERLLLYLLIHAEQVDEHGDLGFQDLRNDRLEKVIDRAAGHPSVHIRIQGIHRGEKNDRQMAQPLALPYQCRGLKSVHRRHAHVEQDHGEFLAHEFA